MSLSSPHRHAVVVGILGSIGQLLANQLSIAGYSVTGIDIAVDDQSAQPHTVIQGDVLRPGNEIKQRLGDAQILVLALAQNVLSEALPQLLPSLRSDCLIVDTLSIKSEFADFVATLDVAQPMVGINPMFSGDLDPAGRPVAVVTYRDGDGDAVARLVEWLHSWPANVFQMTASEHDRTMAYLQTLGHALVMGMGLTLAESAAPLENLFELAPPPFKVMLALLARMTKNHPDVYWEIQSNNPYSQEIRSRMLAQLGKLDDRVNSGSRLDYHVSMAMLRNALKPLNPGLENTSRHLFEQLDQAPKAIEGAPESLADYRQRIDHIDDQLVDLLGQRLSLIREVAQSKKDHQTAVMQPNRVVQVVERCKARGRRHHIRESLIEQLYGLIIDEACQIEYDVIGGPRESLYEASPSAFTSSAEKTQ
ncbi:prephenate dehydrogenase/arogenate dehydrogenase family protein [Pseudomonas fluorescens]|uniref:chorismate mutase n=1 Tax=Pseudomonas fluorescens TaxID=294 RepID=A0A1X9LUQ2_PSEFL|nr:MULTISPECIES: chorismate mutase [Pseudomonas]AQZ26584.1 4-amino-4-deoxychorismate mutase/prephenate dehydrogenase [Pseudomonas fluorescens]ARJ35754.1 chorismate mutase/dehydratase [Pseudomonas fluorescens]MBD8098630.1 prephenate dehydrogenase/arogenate dehydrogenase family protein [Pseudomonas fluorescens]MBD8774512.1 prephenate dehydrogenase/arogenate dehydrogenase family protein [Pseudomonas fluorescens]MBD8780031.1 prephenate dehydrogenase/arogenate dehydrogenase family protein [Pseudomo